MNRFIICLIAIISFTTAITAQNSTKLFKKNWNKVEEFELKNLPKSALQITEDIYQKAKKTNNTSQITKALIYKSKFALTLEEAAQLKIINTFKSEISIAKFPTKNILENVLANLYWQYFKQNRYKFYNRTKTNAKVDENDFRTWDLQTLFNEIHIHFQNSLANDLMSQLEDLNNFNAILNTQEGSKKYRPTLYDFLSYNALNFYKTNETSITKPSYKFEIDNPDYLGGYIAFSKLQLLSKDSISLQYNALLIYQNLINFHKKRDTAALISADIERLNFVRKNAVFKNLDSLQLNALNNLKNQFSSNEASTIIDFKIASIYNNLGNTYISGTKSDKQFKQVEALKICNKAIQQFPESLGAKQCKTLKENILSSTLRITTEKYIPIQLKSKILVSYKNIDTLSFSIYPISETEIKKFNKIYNDSIKKEFINKLTSISTFKSSLKTEKDYQKHTTEIVIPALNNGSYLIVAKPLNRKDVYATTIFQATNILVVDKSTSNNKIFQVLDRNTGQPLVNAKVNIKNVNTGRYNKSINKNLVTNSFGEITFTTYNYHRNVVISVTQNNQKATFDNYYFYENNRRTRVKNNSSKTGIKPFVFTDRSIYRPGQTVYFKAIFLKEHNDITSVFTNEYVEITLEDPNGQNIKQLDLKLNEFGSVSGSFIIPNNGLTGEYAIYVDESSEYDSGFYEEEEDYYFNNSQVQISVEEYKRPKFEAQFKPISETFKLNDSVKVTGNAIAFAGSNISDAKVTYRVHRKVQFPPWFYWRQPQSSSSAQEIINGKTTTDADGNFEITFKAIPDKKVAKENTPIFTYKIEADITDINGETRSATTLVKVGYHTLEASLNISDKLDISEKAYKITLNTTNLNGEFVPSKGTLKIYKLLAPKNVLRKRPWNTPDYQLLSKADYETDFPHEPYSMNETDVKNWEKGTLVFKNNFDTEQNKEVVLNKFKKWELGKYIIELKTQDKFGQPVTDKQIFTVFNNVSTQISDNQLFDISTDKNSYAPFEFIKLKIGSASNNMYVTIAIEKDYKIISTQIISLNNEYKSIEIPVIESDYGGFSIHYSFANYNYFKSGTMPISVPLKQKQLQIETLTFRDKLQPGQKETWSFKIKGEDKEKVTAEILASMYDASLDQFKTHNWQFNPIQQRSYYSYNHWNANNSIRTVNFNVYNLNHSYSSFISQKYDELNWFGLSLKNSNYVNQQYLRSIKRPIIKKSSFDASKKEGYVYGTVYDSDDQPLPGVSVIIKGTSTGVSTDFDGNFTIEAKKGKRLLFSYLGFESSEVKVSKNNIYNIVLTEDSSSLDEVVVVGYGTQRKSDLTGAVAGVQAEALDLEETVIIRGLSSIDSKNKPLYIIDGVPYDGDPNIDPNEILSIEVLKDASATALYGARAANGVIIITTKKGQQKLEQALQKVKTRKNFNETAFFYPNLKTDEEGNFSFSFTMPEALTKWKLQLLAHTKEAISASKTLTTITQKELMVLPNPPRFLREGDEIVFSSKISNLTSNSLNGIAQLILTDAISGKEINNELENISATKNFLLDAKGNTNVSWTLKIPENIQAVQYKIVAKAGDFSDGEQNVLPVLSNRMLVTETLPMWVRGNQTKTFTINKLKNNTSTTLSNHKLTLEITSNPAWYAIQSLPYLMEYPYECAEQTFSRFYANTLASHIANSNPRIQEVFNLWKTSDALVSNLEKNEELKSIIIQETPWLRDAKNETEQKKRIALLFDLNNMNNEQQKALKKLEQLQFRNGGFPWFKGSNYPNRYITQHIAASYGHLNQLNVDFKDTDAQKIMEKAVQFLDEEILNDYNKLLKQANKLKEQAKTKQLGLKASADYLAKNNIGYTQLHYLYMRSFYGDLTIRKNIQTAVDYYTQQSATYWTDFNLYSKGLIALIHYRNNNKTISTSILKSLKETSITSDELGMYWKENTSSWYWYQAPIETQALLIEAFSEIENDIATVDELKVWLLKNKQTKSWKTTKETTEAVYALLLQGSDWLSVNETVDVTIGNKKIEPSKLENVKVEAGTGYYKTSWNGNEITPEMAEVSISKKDNGIAWGSLYWQYFEDLDKITTAATPLKLSKKLFLKTNSDKGKVLTEISEETVLKLGDLITVRIELKVDRPMEFIHMKDMRASGLEPINILSSYKWQDGLGYFESTKDASTNFFIENLPKGVYIFEYDLRINNAGNFSNGITTIQSMYAPEFSSHSEGIRINVGK